MRGEYEVLKQAAGEISELPPRARRIPGKRIHSTHGRGTTSACAENTGGCLVLILHGGNYLRVRGEYIYDGKEYPEDWELPPRARRIGSEARTPTATIGTTSACAENTFSSIYFVPP